MSGRNQHTSVANVEVLESRQMLSGTPLGISQVALAGGGTQLQILGTAGSDRITVNQNATGQVVVGNTGGWTATLPGGYKSIRIDAGAGDDSVTVGASVTANCVIFGGLGNDTLQAGSGADTLYAGAGTNVLRAGSGDDTLVSIGSAADSLYGGAGKDSFWTDNVATERIFNLRADETAYGGVHKVTNFYGSTTPTNSVTAGKVAKLSAKAKKAAAKLAAAAAALPEPTVNDARIAYKNFSDHPLFSDAGPKEDDIRQGNIGDCYFLSVLSAVAKVDPMKLRQSVLDLGDGTYVVQFNKGGQNVFVHVDANLPTWSWNASAPAYAGLGAQGSLWVAVMEKAFTFVRTSSASYASIDSGWMDQTFTALGVRSNATYSAATGAALLSLIQSQVKAGLAVTYATTAPAYGAPVISGHAYTVDAVLTDASGTPTALRLRNPWGVDGAGNDGNPNDGYVTLTGQQALGSFLGLVSAAV